MKLLSELYHELKTRKILSKIKDMFSITKQNIMFQISSNLQGYASSISKNINSTILTVRKFLATFASF